MFARGSSARDGENAGSDDNSHAQRNQAPNAQRLFQPPLGLFGSRDQSIDAFGAQELLHRSTAHSRSRLGMLALPLALGHLLHPFFEGAASDSGCAFGFGSRLL